MILRSGLLKIHIVGIYNAGVCPSIVLRKAQRINLVDKLNNLKIKRIYERVISVVLQSINVHTFISMFV